MLNNPWFTVNEGIQSLREMGMIEWTYSKFQTLTQNSKCRLTVPDGRNCLPAVVIVTPTAQLCCVTTFNCPYVRYGSFII